MSDFRRLNDIENLNGLSKSIEHTNTDIDGFELTISQPAAVAKGVSQYNPVIYIKKMGDSGYMVFEYSKGVKIISGTPVDTTVLKSDLETLLSTLGEQ